jgi:hypothetical protein
MKAKGPAQVLAPDVRNCRTKAMPCIEREFIGSTDCQADSQVQNVAAQLEWIVGFIGRTTLLGREGVPPREQQAPFTCGHQMEWVDSVAS